MHEEWLKFAQTNLDSAEFLCNMKPTPVEVICYHCEQASEKLLKAILVASNIELPKHMI